jgi:hypothetical protein
LLQQQIEPRLAISGYSEPTVCNSGPPTIRVAYTDPFGLSPCSDLREEIDGNAADLQGRIERYVDAYGRGEADTGHLKQIQQRRNTHDRLTRKYKQKKCDKDDDHDNWNSGANAIRHFEVPEPQLDQSAGWKPYSLRMTPPTMTPVQAGWLTAAGVAALVIKFWPVVFAF